jgi:hypothetical protein
MSNQAIMFVGWGAKGTLDAEKAVKRLPASSNRDIYIVADHDLSLQTEAQLIKVEFVASHTLRKAEGIVKYSPDGYSSILYLDSDITLLEDVPYVFSKAESHGLAMAIAPTYSLDEYRSFGAVLEREGIPSVGQVQYQAGLIAFAKKPEVIHVFNKWIELGKKHSDIWVRDQPQLSLALEICDFQPFVLSKNYNFRGLFEPLIGKVRVWHSFAPVPENINEYVTPYPPRLLSRGAIRNLRRSETHGDAVRFFFQQRIINPLYLAALPTLRLLKLAR